MNGIRLLYGALILFIGLDAIAATIAAWSLFRMRQRIGWYIARAITGVAADATVTSVTAFISSGPQRIVIWVVILRIVARIYKTYEMARLPLFLHGYINGDKPEVMSDPK